MQSELNNLKNVIIGFDPAACTVRIFRLSGTDASTAVCNDIKIEKSIFERGEYGEALKTSLSYYTKNVANIQNAYIVLPDSLVAGDYVTLPKINKKKLLDSLRTEIVKLYANSVNLNILTVQVDSKSEDSALFFVTIANTLFINDISTGLAKSSVQPRLFTFSAACSLNTLLEQRSDLRDKDFVFADIRKSSATLISCSKGVIRGFTDLPFGTNVLRSDMIYPENAVFDNNDAQEAADAALVKASGGKHPLTESYKPNYDDPDISDAEREQRRLDYFASLIPDGLKRTSAPDELEMIYANFLIFEKYIELFIASNRGKECMPDCDRVVVNIPEDYYFLKDSVGENRDVMTYEFLDNRNKNNAFVYNFDLYGALLIRKFNTEQIF